MINNELALKFAIEAIKKGELDDKKFNDAIKIILEIISMSVIEVANKEEQPTLEFLMPFLKNLELFDIDELKGGNRIKLVQDILNLLINKATEKRVKKCVIEDLEKIQMLLN